MPVRAQGGLLCGPIRVMEGLRDRASLALEEIGGFVADLGPTQRLYVEKARALMTPVVCAGARRVAFITTDKGDGRDGWVFEGRPDLIHLPESLASERLFQRFRGIPIARADTLHSIVHEATHAASNLLKEYAASADERTLTNRAGQALLGSDEWTDAGRDEARRIVERSRLRRGLYTEWDALHQSFVKAGEDIAEFTAAIRTRDVHAEEGSSEAPRDVACQVMRKQPGPGVPDGFTPFFTKVGFLHSVGFISDDDYDYCVGNLKIRGSGNGIFSFDDGIQVHEYLGNPRGSIGRAPKSNAWMFQFEERHRHEQGQDHPCHGATATRAGTW